MSLSFVSHHSSVVHDLKSQFIVISFAWLVIITTKNWYSPKTLVFLLVLLSHLFISFYCWNYLTWYIHQASILSTVKIEASRVHFWLVLTNIFLKRTMLVISIVSFWYIKCFYLQSYWILRKKITLLKLTKGIFKYNHRYWSSILQNLDYFVFYRGLRWQFLQTLVVGLQTLLWPEVYLLQRSARYLSPFQLFIFYEFFLYLTLVKIVLQINSFDKHPCVWGAGKRFPIFFNYLALVPLMKMTKLFFKYSLILLKLASKSFLHNLETDLFCLSVP
jgi:hypothetical protein